MSPRRLVIAFLKHPTPGKVKTRLASSLGDGPAAAIYRQLVDRALRQIPASCSLRICFDPPGKEEAVRDWLGAVLAERGGETEFRPQPGGDLGKRLAAGFGEAFADGYRQATAIGGDCIAITPAHYAAAWAFLEAGRDAVYGPASDGGYYLLALKETQPALFTGISWGQRSVLKESLAAAAAAGLATDLLGELDDVDDVDDWERARELLR